MVGGAPNFNVKLKIISLSFGQQGGKPNLGGTPPPLLVTFLDVALPAMILEAASP